MFGALVEEINKDATDRGRPVARARLSDSDERLREVLPVIGRYVEAQVKPLRQRIAELESRLEQFTYCGVWQTSAKYVRGNFCSHDGSLWHANVDSCGVKPGSNSAAWTLCVKRGKDGKA